MEGLGPRVVGDYDAMETPDDEDGVGWEGWDRFLSRQHYQHEQRWQQPCLVHVEKARQAAAQGWQLQPQPQTSYSSQLAVPQPNSWLLPQSESQSNQCELTTAERPLLQQVLAPALMWDNHGASATTVPCSQSHPQQPVLPLQPQSSQSQTITLPQSRAKRRRMY